MFDNQLIIFIRHCRKEAKASREKSRLMLVDNKNANVKQERLREAAYLYVMQDLQEMLPVIGINNIVEDS